jgi:hypothetical protein
MSNPKSSTISATTTATMMTVAREYPCCGRR